MSFIGRMGRHGRLSALRRATVVSLVAMGFLAFTASAFATRVLIVTQGSAPASNHKILYFKTIQSAVNASKSGDWILIEPGVYYEEVKVTKPHSNIWIRGMNRNEVILDGKNEPKPEGSNGIEVYEDNDVYIENLTVRNFDRAEPDGPGGNEIWWNGGAESEKIGAHGWWGRYLTAYDTGLDGGYGIFTNNEKEGAWENIYASGFNDSGMYIGACPECEAVVKKATMEYNALGYSGSNAGGNLVIEDSTFNHNTTGIAPNSENPGDGPPPQNGKCPPNVPVRKGHKGLPKFTTTEIPRCTIIRDNRIEYNNDLNAPSNPSSAAAPWGAGVELPGDYADEVEGNLIKGSPTDGVLMFEYPNPYPPTEQTIYFQNAGNKISENTFEDNGEAGEEFSGDVFDEGGVFGERASTNDCFAGNTFADETHPAELEGTWGCQNSTTPNSSIGLEGVFYLVHLQEVSEARTSEPQPAPPEQETMPEPCEGVPANPLCEHVVSAAKRR